MGTVKTIIIDHGNSYQTLYAHLSAIKVKKGSQIKRGQIIGNIGNSGLTTSTHLHYEVRIDGIPHNPLTVSLPGYKALSKNELDAWKIYTTSCINFMDSMRQHKLIKK